VTVGDLPETSVLPSGQGDGGRVPGVESAGVGSDSHCDSARAPHSSAPGKKEVVAEADEVSVLPHRVASRTPNPTKRRRRPIYRKVRCPEGQVPGGELRSADLPLASRAHGDAGGSALSTPGEEEVVSSLETW
jgi:hypothetical protein